VTADQDRPDQLVNWARATAQELLSSTLPRRWAHTQGVAAAAADLVGALTAAPAATLVAAAWLHDIGDAPAVATTGFHPLDGARYLARQGFPDEVVSLVAVHTGAQFEADRRGLAAQLATLPAPDPVLLDAMTSADMTTSPAGGPVTAEARLVEIFNRYRPGSPASDAVHISAPYLLAAVSRCQHRNQAAAQYEIPPDPWVLGSSTRVNLTADRLMTSLCLTMKSPLLLPTMSARRPSGVTPSAAPSKVWPRWSARRRRSSIQ
jgi:predicted HD phosphohydrolase